MIFDKIKQDNEIGEELSTQLVPSSVFCYVGYDNGTSGRVSLKLRSSNTNIPIQTISNEATVVPISLSSTTNLDYQLGDVFYVDQLTAGTYTIIVSNLGGTELRGKSILLYLNNAPANTTINFGAGPIITTTTTASYCAAFCNLQGTSTITCLSVWKTPGATST